MKTVLLLSSIYPGPDIPANSTPVVHYFAKEWKKMGYNVRVIVNSTYFIPFIYWAPRCVKNFIGKNTSVTIPQKRLKDICTYELDGIKVTRCPMFKMIPMGGFSRKILDNQVDTISRILSSEQFIPDIIIGHWANPQMYLVAKLGKLYKATTALVLHESGSIVRKIPDYQNVMKGINKWGYRSLSIKKKFFQEFSIEPTFRCFSGIPASYIENHRKRNWINITSYIYVGQLIKIKYPDIVIKTLKNYYTAQKFELNIIGSGPMDKELRFIAQKDSRINFLGQIPRSQIRNALDTADIFIMVSSGEVFGLVYIEAMARGCIVIAASGEGMDGIIENGVNGFLCQSGSVEALKNTLETIELLTPKERSVISKNAIKTASEMTDFQVAKQYIDSIIN